MAVLGIGVLGVGAFIVLGSSPSVAQPGGGGGTKKEGLVASMTETTGPPPSGDTIYNIIFGDPGFGGNGGLESFAPDPIDTIADVIAPGDPARKVYASTYMPGYKQPSPPTKKEQRQAEHSFTTRTGGGERDLWIGGR